MYWYKFKEYKYRYSIIWPCIVRTAFLKGESKIWLLLPEGGGGGGGESEKLKGGGTMMQGQVFLKEGGLALFLLNFFKVYHFYI